MKEDPIKHTITKNNEWQRENRDDLVTKYLAKYEIHNPSAGYTNFNARIKEANPNVVWSKLKLGQVVNIPMDIPQEEQEEETTEETTNEETNNESTSESTSSTEEETTQESSGKPSKAGIYPVCNGAECMCDQSKEKLPALLKVISHKHVYINDKDSTEKLIATTNDLPLPFEKQANTFGTCLKQPLGFGQYKPCIPNITKWDKSYQAIKLAQAGNGEALLEESEGECSFKGKITFTTHGQTQVVTTADAAETPPEIAAMLTDGLLTEEEAETLTNGTFEDNKTKEIEDIEVKGSLTPTNHTYTIHTDHKEIIFKVNKPKELTKTEKAAINWAVYIKNKNGTYKHHHTFVDQGDRLTFPYRSAGTYAIEAYGDTKKFDIATGNCKGSASNLLEIKYQNIKGLSLFVNEEDNRTNLKIIRPTEKTTITVNPLFPDATAIKPRNIYWQATSKGETIDFERVTGVPQISIPPQNNTEAKKITVTATLGSRTESITFKVKNNTVASVSANKDTICVLSEGEQEKERHKVTFTAKYLLPYTPALGDPIPKWCVYNTGEDPHAKNIIAGENKLTYTGTSNKIGEWYVEAFANNPDGKGTKATLKAILPKITKAYWADKNGNSISKSGFKHTVYLHLETQALQGEQLQLNVWFGKQGSGKYQKQAVPCIEIKQANGIINQGYTLPEFKGTDNLDYFFTIENLPFTIQGTDQYPQAKNQLIVSNNCTPKFLNVRSKQQITSLKIYETGNKLHTGIVKYGDIVTLKISTRNLIDQELEFEVWKDAKADNYTDEYSTYDTMDDIKFSETIKIKIDNEGNGETPFTIPTNWKDYQGDKPVQLFYLKEKESGVEFPRAYYVANPNKTEEENKSNSRRIRALMLKVAKNLELDEATETNNAVILGEELTAGADGDCKGKNCIRLGAESKLIQEINIRLAGFGGNVPTEKFTPRTVTMVKQFQKDYMQIEPTGNICGDTLKAIDEFGEKYTFSFDEIKCKCGVCSGFGQGQYKNEYRSGKPKKEAFYNYEYPGIHRSLLWSYKAMMFYLTKKEDSKFSINKIYSGYRCHEDNKLHSRKSTNHMGKAIDIHFNKDGTRTKALADIERIRDKVIIPTNKAQIRWSSKNLFSVEPSRKNTPLEFIATTWIHMDVRQFESEYLKDDFFADTDTKLKGEKTVDLAKNEGFSKTCNCIGTYVSQQGATTNPKGLKERVAPKTLYLSDNGVDFLKGWESEKKEDGKHVLYDDDAGYCTIGWGHLVSGKNSCESINNIPQNFKNGLTDEEAKELLKTDLKIYENIVKENVSVNLYQYEFDALVSFVFNLGGPNFKSSTMLRKLNASKYGEVPNEFPKWNKSGGVVMGGLTTRRKREANIFKNNIYDSTH